MWALEKIKHNNYKKQKTQQPTPTTTGIYQEIENHKKELIINKKLCADCKYIFETATLPKYFIKECFKCGGFSDLNKG